MSKLLLAAILTPIVVAVLVITAIVRYFRPESSILLFSSIPAPKNPECFRSAVTAVEREAKISATSARIGSINVKFQTHGVALKGANAYRFQCDEARALVAKHRSWTSIWVSAPRPDLPRARSLAAKIAAQLVDGGVDAVWSSDGNVACVVDARQIANLRNGDQPVATA